VNTSIISEQHMDNGGHEGRLQALEKTQGEMMEMLGVLNSKTDVQGTKIDMILTKFNELEKPGSTRLCDFHKQSLDDYKGKLVVLNAELDSVKTKTNLIIGGLILLQAFSGYMISQASKCPESSRITRLEARQELNIKMVEEMQRVHNNTKP
jgi:hypothetical protein